MGTIRGGGGAEERFKIAPFAEVDEEYIELGSPSFWLCWFLEINW
jgi:hypothetical protein